VTVHLLLLAAVPILLLALIRHGARLALALFGVAFFVAATLAVHFAGGRSGLTLPFYGIILCTCCVAADLLWRLGRLLRRLGRRRNGGDSALNLPY
jgi:hypothetical protein